MKSVLIYIIAFIACFPVDLYGQSGGYYTNKGYFIEASKAFGEKYWAAKRAAKAYAVEKNIPIAIEFNQEVMVLEEISATGLAVYRKLYNSEAARSVNTDLLRPGAALSLNLEGEGMIVGVWDGDNFKEDHIEFENRAETRGSISDEPLGLGGNHSTHVSGTIASAGINPGAKGMAPKTNLFLYDFLNDKAEISSELAKDDPLLVSNHSYGLVLGWAANETGWVWRGDPAISNNEDYRFGYYDGDNSRALDDIAFNAPYYLHVRAAGNDRTDVGDGTRPPDGPYDCIGPAGVAKNVLTVGASLKLGDRYTGPDDVIMSEFSSWGPTDDGRIKPDITAPGVSILSTIAEGNNEYGNQDGTSMATPAVTGSLILLQEQFSKATGGRFMRAATLKGLIIHTANEAGVNNGPDYQFGWGLLSTDKAANIITRRDGENFIMDEVVLSDGDSMVYQVTASGSSPLLATISWTDPAGTPPAAALNPTDLMLVNDLDIRIYDEDNNIYEPWILDPGRPDRGATRGDNFRDNVEKIEIQSPAQGSYTVVIRHKGELRNGRQEVSVIISNGDLERDLDAFYWVGGSGSWQDGSSWSNRSGGASINAVPGIDNPVFFDQNSFASSDNNINLTTDAACYNINYYATEACSFILANNTLTINGTLNLESDNVDFQGGQIVFNGSTAKMNYVRAGSGSFSSTDLAFNSTNGTWNVINDLTTKDLLISGSNFIARGNNLNIRNFNTASLSGRQIDLSGTAVTGIATFVMDPEAEATLNNMIFSLNSSSSPSGVIIDGGDKTYGRLLADGIDIDLGGNNAFRSIRMNGALTLEGSNSIDTLTVTDQSSLVLYEGSTQTLNSDFQASGSESNLILVTSNGNGNAFLFADDPNIRFCLDYLDIRNVSVSGATGFLTGDNSLVNANSAGWIEIDCADALFPSFEVQFPCAGGLAQFIDTSTGEPLTWEWNFGDPQFPETNTSEEQNPDHLFNFASNYEITFRVRNADFDQTITRMIEIVESDGNLSRPTVVVDGERLTSSVIAPNYQWYFNGNMIDGANQRIYEIRQPGVYSVMISDDQCRFGSDETIVTSLDADLSSSGSLRIYPNPVEGILNIDLTPTGSGPVVFTVYNTIGKAMLRTVQPQPTDTKDQLHGQIDLRRLPPGVYQLVIFNGSKTKSKTVIKR
jgi:hypothetical protein